MKLLVDAVFYYSRCPPSSNSTKRLRSLLSLASLLANDPNTAALTTPYLLRIGTIFPLSPASLIRLIPRKRKYNNNYAVTSATSMCRTNPDNSRYHPLIPSQNILSVVKEQNEILRETLYGNT